MLLKSWSTSLCGHVIDLQVVILVSSANIRAVANLTHAGRSFMQMRKSSGPRIDPCRTPQVTVRGCEVLPSTIHNSFLLLKYNLIQLRATPLIPYNSSFCKRMSSDTVSKALARSRKTIKFMFPRSTLKYHSFVASNSAVAVECNEQKPD